MYILLLEEIGRAVVNALRTLSLTIFDALLTGINVVYAFFMKLATYRLLDDSTITDLYTRIGLILGLFMVFRLTFSAIEYLVNPDTMTDKTKGIGNIIKKVLIMIALLGSVHFLFDKAYDLQDLLLKGSNNVMSKLILGEVSKDSEEDDNEADGKDLSWTIFTSFYTFNEDICSNPNSKYTIYCPSSGGTSERSIDGILESNVKNGNNMSIAYPLIEEGEERTISTIDGGTEDSYVYLINFDWFYGIACAAAVLWILIVYVIQLGVRVIQLAYLEIIAPIPIMMYLTPKGDETLKKWGQQCLTTFLDAFIRIAILYFIILIVRIISGSALLTGGLSTGIVLILGLFMFAKKVPDLLGELFPSMGGKAGLSFGIKSPKALLNDIPVAGSLANKAIGYAAKPAKALGGVIKKNTVDRARDATVGRIKRRYNDWLTNREESNKQREEQAAADKAWNRYGEAYKSKQYKEIFSNETATALKNLDTAKELAKKQYGENTVEYTNAIQPYKDKVDKIAKRNNEYQRLQNLKNYENFHPEQMKEEDFKFYSSSSPQSTPSSGSSSSPQSTPESTPWVSPQEREEDAYNRFLDVQGNGGSDEEVQSALQDYENARQVRQELDNDLDDFYERQNDGYGGQ